MAVIIATTKGTALLECIKKQIDAAKYDRSKIDTWIYNERNDFTLTPAQWANRAWMRPFIHPDTLTFNFVGNKQELTTREIFAVYHGRLVEMLIKHCPEYFSRVQATSDAVTGDIIIKANLETHRTV